MSDKQNRHRRRPSQSVFTDDFSAPLSDDNFNGAAAESNTAASTQLRQQIRNPLPPAVAADDAAVSAAENDGKAHDEKAKGVGN